MFERVLVATDFSRYADRVLECIGEIPGMEAIVLVHVIHLSPVTESPALMNWSTAASRDRARKILEEKRITLERMAGVPVSTLLLEGVGGDTAGAIIGAARVGNNSLIVMGGRGQSLIRNLVLGSVSKEVIRRSRIDVLILHFQTMNYPDEIRFEKFCRNIFSHVLCPVDFSKPSDTTVARLKDLDHIQQVTLLHVVDPGTSGPDAEAITRNAEQSLTRIEAALRSQGIRCASIIRTGIPAHEICRAAEDLDISLIMIARSGQSDYVKNIVIGKVANGVVSEARRPLFMINPHISLSVSVHELLRDEFSLAEVVWQGYHGQKPDPQKDRIFGVFVEGTLVAVARCKRHHDGLEVDGVYVPEEYRGRGYARTAMNALIDACGNEPLFMHSTLELVRFYGTFGFRPIPESELPPTIKERFNFAGGEMKGADAQPMRRDVPVLRSH